MLKHHNGLVSELKSKCFDLGFLSPDCEVLEERINSAAEAIRQEAVFFGGEGK